MANLVEVFRNTHARQRRGSIRDTESRQEEEGGQANAGVLKMIETTPKIKFLKRCFEIGSLLLKILFAFVLLVIILNMIGSLAFKTVTSERLNLFGLANSSNVTNKSEKAR